MDARRASPGRPVASLRRLPPVRQAKPGSWGLGGDDADL